MPVYEISAYEYKWVNGAPTEDVETYVVSVDGKEGPVFVTHGEALEWIENQSLTISQDPADRR